MTRSEQFQNNAAARVAYQASQRKPQSLLHHKFSGKISSNHALTTSSDFVVSENAGESIIQLPIVSLLKKISLSMMVGSQNSNADDQVRNTLAKIRRSLDTVPQIGRDCVCGELYQECDELNDGELVGLLEDIRNSLRVMAPGGSQLRHEKSPNIDIANADLMMVLEEIREGVLALQETTRDKLVGDISQSKEFSKTMPQSEPKIDQDSYLTNAILEIRRGVAALVENIKAQENKEIDEVLGSVRDIRRSLQVISVGEENKFSAPNCFTNALLERSANAIAQSINSLVNSVNTISQQLQVKNWAPEMMKASTTEDEGEEKCRKMKKRNRKKRLRKPRHDGISKESECTCEKFVKYLIDRKEEPMRPCQYIIPSIEPPPVYIAPVCRPPSLLSVPVPQQPSERSQTMTSQPVLSAPTSQMTVIPPPIVCFPVACCPPPMSLSPKPEQYQSAPDGPCSCQHKQPQEARTCRKYRVLSPSNSKGRLVQSLPATFTLSFTGNVEEKSNIWKNRNPDLENRIFLCKEIAS